MTNIVHYTSLISLSFIILAGTFILFFLFSTYYGKSKLVSLIFSFYPALVIYEKFPFFKEINSVKGSLAQQSAIRLVIFLLLIFLSYIIINKAMSMELSYSKVKGTIESAVLSLIALVLTLVLVVKIVPINALYRLPSSITSFFAPDTYLFWWLLAPLVIIFAISRR
jgi:hypothetical protein